MKRHRYDDLDDAVPLAATSPVESGTPRTDAVLTVGRPGPQEYGWLANFARQLERELAEKQAELSRLRGYDTLNDTPLVYLTALEHERDALQAALAEKQAELQKSHLQEISTVGQLQQALEALTAERQRSEGLRCAVGDVTGQMEHEAARDGHPKKYADWITRLRAALADTGSKIRPSHRRD